MKSWFVAAVGVDGTELTWYDVRSYQPWFAAAEVYWQSILVSCRHGTLFYGCKWYTTLMSTIQLIRHRLRVMNKAGDN